jgi:hypothetical protein
MCAEAVSSQAALAHVALHVSEWLDASALGRLEQSCVALRAALSGEAAWRGVLRDARRRQGRVLSLWRAVAAHSGVLGGPQQEEVCASRQVLSALSLRWALDVRLFLPEMLGYSLIHPSHSSHSFSVLLSEACGESCAAVRRLVGAGSAREWVFLVSSGVASERLTFDSPYKTYWLWVEPRLSGGRRAGHVVSCGAHELLSLSAHVVAEVEHVRSQSDDRSPLQRQLHSASPGYFTSSAAAVSGAAHTVSSLAGATVPASAATSARSWCSREEGVCRTTTWVSSTLSEGAAAAPHPHSQGDEQAQPSLRAFFLVNSSTKSSTVHVERFAVAVTRCEYVRLAGSVLRGP